MGHFPLSGEVDPFIRDNSLPRWIAYWAIGNLPRLFKFPGPTSFYIGWQITCTAYCIKIEEVFDGMIRLSSEVLPENRRFVRYYIHKAWKMMTVFVQSIKREEGLEELGVKFEPYVTAEEARIRRNLEDVKYRIDGSDTFQVIAGEGRIEMVIAEGGGVCSRCLLCLQC